MGHNLLRGNVTKADTVANDSLAVDSTVAAVASQEVAGLSLGAYSGYAAIGLDGYRFIAKYPAQDETHLFADSDLRQENELTGKQQDDESRATEKSLSATLDTLIRISDYSLERGL